MRDCNESARGLPQKSYSVVCGKRGSGHSEAAIMADLRYDRFNEYEGYDTAQVCLNGHTINEFAHSQSQRNQRFCGKCGTKTITQCPSCNQAIRGFYHNPGDLNLSRYTAPKFCHNCGEPYPWTARGLTAARELISEAENLKPEEKESLRKSLDDLVRDTPGTQVAAIRFKKFVSKAGKETADALRKIIVDVASETAKKILFP
jgi:hypothetical protein